MFRRGPYGKRKYEEETLEFERPNEDINSLPCNTGAKTLSYTGKVLNAQGFTQMPFGQECNLDRPLTGIQSTSEQHCFLNEGQESLFLDNDEDLQDSQSDSDSGSEIFKHDLPETEPLSGFFYDEELLEGHMDGGGDTNLNRHSAENTDDQPLFPGASISVGAVMLLLAVFITSHNLTGEAIQQLLSIFVIALPNGHKLGSSLHSFKNFFNNLKTPIVKHYYCGNCLGFIADRTAARCPYRKCKRALDEKNLEYFLEVPVDKQLKSLYSQEGFYSATKERFNLEHGPTYRDIYDGELYRSYVKNNGPLSFPDNISFTFNTDGASVFKSSNVSVWPLFLVINELPYRMRMKKDNMILAGLWFGKKKPSMGTFLHPFLDTFKEFENGIRIHSPERGDFVMKAFLICGTADLPARSLLCNRMQYNGAHSCWKCHQSGETAKKGAGHCRVFPFLEENPKGPLRTKESVLVDAKAAIDQQGAGIKKYAVHGVKGPSWLSLFPLFNIVNGISIDYMHGVLLGIQKLLLELWFSSSHKGKSYNYYDQIQEADRRLLSIKPTLSISRLPRSIQTDLKYWKASEYRSFLLYYGAAVLKGILDQPRFHHFLYFVNAIHILLKFDASVDDIASAELMLFEFVKLFSSLYGTCFMTLNLHQLVHLADSVRLLGPLYTHSCFPFEDKNGVLMKMIRGTQNIDSQKITGVSFLQKLPELRQKTIQKGSEVEKLYIAIDSPHVLTRGLKIDDGIYVLGCIHSKKLTNIEYLALSTSVGHDIQQEQFQSFKRLELHSDLIYGTAYSRMNKRDNSAIVYVCSDNETEYFGRVKDFVVLKNDQDLKYCVFAITQELKRKQASDSFMLVVEKTETVYAVPLLSVKGSCMLISYTNLVGSEVTYVCKFPNKLEGD